MSDGSADDVRAAPPKLGIWRVQLDLLVRAEDVEAAIGSLQMTCAAVKIRGWSWSEIMGRDGRTNPAWRVEQNGDEITVEQRRKRKKAFNER